MINFELHSAETSSTYKFKQELKFIIFKVLLEMREVIETFSTRHFLGIKEEPSDSKEKNQLQNLVESIAQMKEKNQKIRTQFMQSE
jgi:hypothetical protein